MWNRVEIPIVIQTEDDGTFLDEFSSQPSAGQMTLILPVQFFKRVLTVLIFSDSQTKVKRFKAKSSERVSQSRKESDMSDQTFTNDRILSQLDAISKRLDAIENSSVSALVNKLHAVEARLS